MSTRVVDRVDEWDERPFTDGYRSLHEFADEEFSGVVRAGGAELYMTKGTVVGIRHGSIEDFDDGGTAYESPSPALPLLAVMQETNDEVRAEYYSEQTAIAEVDSTLADGGFTGYIELSDNVLSGDYYLVYHGGRSMNVGFIGESARLVDGDEAFDTADDEVGIYQVRPADVEVVELPEVEDEPAGGVDEPADEQATGAGGDEDDADVDDPDEADADTDPDEGGDGADADDEGGAEGETDDGDEAVVGDEATDDTEDDPSTEQAGTEGGTADDDVGTDEAVASTAGRADPDDGTGGTEPSAAETRQSQGGTTAESEADAGGSTAEQEAAAAADGRTTSAERSASSTAETDGQQTGAVRTDSQPGAKQRQSGGPAQAGGQPRGRSQGRGAEQTSRATGTPQPDVALETRAIPSLDPARTSDPDEGGGNARADTFGRAQDRDAQPSQQGSRTSPSTQQQTSGEPSSDGEGPTGAASETGTQGATGTTTDDQSGSEATVDPERVEELQAELDERDEEIARLEAELDRKTTEHEDAKSQLESLREERDELATEVEELEAELDRLETQFGAATDAERRMTPSEALAGTDIFPRYESKGDATLKKAHGGSHRREDVLGNLRLEQNTQFDADSVSVGGQSYEEFLESTLEYRFVNWAVGNLLFEIRETGHEKALTDLYDSLPVIDWADLKGTVEVIYTEDGQETRSQESFDVVLRNRMGEPLIVANLNDSREGATESMMENLIRSAERVGQSSDAFAGAFLVTRSFFEPPALETADAATRGGLLSRDKRKSFVNLSRKNGYHLCLVEARNENFTLLVPEL